MPISLELFDNTDNHERKFLELVVGDTNLTLRLSLTRGLGLLIESFLLGLEMLKDKNEIRKNFVVVMVTYEEIIVGVFGLALLLDFFVHFELVVSELQV